MSQWTPLHQAAQTGNSDELKKLIETGDDLNAVTKLGWTPLHFSAWYGYLDCCRILIEAGSAMYMPTTLRFWTPCHLAALEGHTEIVRLFLEHGADINARTAEGWTPLHAAVEHAHLETVRFLLERGADPNLAKRPDRTTFPLHSAARNGRRDIVQILLDFGADPNVKNKYGELPGNLAKEVGFSGIAEMLEIKPESQKPVKEPDSIWIMNLIRGGDLQRLENWLDEGGSISYVPKNGQSLLSYAIFFGQPNTVRYLLEHGAAPKGRFGWFSGSALNGMLASGMASGRREYIEVAEILLDHGFKPFSGKEDHADPFHVNTFCCPSVQVLPLSLLDRLEAAGLAIEPALKKKMALRWAVKVRDHAEAEQLLKEGADPNAGSGYGDIHAPLHAAIQANDVEMVRLLVQYGAKVNKKSGYGNSFLYDAASDATIEIVKILVEAGANVNRKTDFGSPIQAALKEGKTEIVDYLIEHGADLESRTNWVWGHKVDASSTPIFSALASGDGKLIQKLIDEGADIHVIGDRGNTLLHIAAEKGLTRWVKYFLEQGMDIEAENWDHRRPLHLAALHKRKETIQYLMNHGASVEIPPPAFPPVIYTMMLGRIDLLETILENDPNEANRRPDDHAYGNWAQLPILVALELENREMIELLVKHGAWLTLSLNIYHEGAWGHSALSYVSQQGMKDLLELFLKQNINVNSKSSPRPALHCAASVEIAQMLLDHGANPYLRSNEHRTALECQLQNKEVADLLRGVMSREPEHE